MGSQSRFKFVRGVPAQNANAIPPFEFYSFEKVRQLGTTFNPIGPGPVSAIWGQVIVPASTWAYQKHLIMRAGLKVIIPAGGLPPAYNIQEQLILTGGPVFNMPTAAPFVPVAGTYTTAIEWRMYNDGTNLYVWNAGLVQPFYSLNNDDNVQHVAVYSVIAGTINLNAPITIVLAAKLPLSIPGAQLVPLWLESFVEQGTNLGRAVY